jgi:hypothetical protein
MEVLLATFTFVVGVPPRLTLAPEAKPVPVIVTEVPPPVGPVLGEIEVTVGAAAPPPPLDRARIVLSSSSEPGEVLR